MHGPDVLLLIGFQPKFWFSQALRVLWEPLASFAFRFVNLNAEGAEVRKGRLGICF